jgi:hypothetical protein
MRNRNIRRWTIGIALVLCVVGIIVGVVYRRDWQYGGVGEYVENYAVYGNER